jgi:hypothetical protein
MLYSTTWVAVGGPRLELAHDGHDRLAGAQQHLAAGDLLHDGDLLVDDAEEVDRARRPQLPVLLLLWLTAQIRLCMPSLLLAKVSPPRKKVAVTIEERNYQFWPLLISASCWSYQRSNTSL